MTAEERLSLRFGQKPQKRSTDDQRRMSLCCKIWTKCFPSGSQKEAKEVISIAWAITLSSLLQFFLQSTSVIMCGHLSAIELDSVSLANSLISVLGVHIIGGMSTAFDTFFSQSFGAGNKKAVGIYLQRALILAFLVLVCLYCIHLNIEPILINLGQDPVKAVLAANYITFLLPGLFFDFTFQTIAKYLQNQGRVIPPMICAVIGNIFNIISQYVAIYVFGFGSLASAICQSCSFCVMVISVLSYIMCSGVYKDTWDGWKLKEALSDWGTFMRLALPGILLYSLEAWCFEIGIIVAGMIDTVQMGAQAIVFQLETWTFMFPLGISIATSIRIGHKLGAGDVTGASIVYRVSLAMMMLISSTIMALILSFRCQLPLIFSSDEDVVAVSTTIIPIFSVFFLFVGIIHVTSGALRGCGHHLFGAVTVFVCYYFIGLPIGISLALLTPLMVKGFWIGLVTSIMCELISFVTFFGVRVDWQREVDKAKLVSGIHFEEHKMSELDDETSKLLGSTKIDYKTSRRANNSMRTPRSLIFRRLLIIAVVFAGLIVSILTRMYVPKTWRPPCIPVNNETVQISQISLPYCNNGTQLI